MIEMSLDWLSARYVGKIRIFSFTPWYLVFVSWLSSKFSIPLKLDKIESNVYRWRRCCQFRSEKKFLLFESLQILYNGWHFCRLSHLLKSGNRVDEKWMRTGVTKWKNLFSQLATNLGLNLCWYEITNLIIDIIPSMQTHTPMLTHPHSHKRSVISPLLSTKKKPSTSSFFT